MHCKKKNIRFFIQNLLGFVPMGPMNIKLALFQAMACCWTSNYLNQYWPSSPTQLSITKHQWVKQCLPHIHHVICYTVEINTKMSSYRESHVLGWCCRKVVLSPQWDFLYWWDGISILNQLHITAAQECPYVSPQGERGTVLDTTGNCIYRCFLDALVLQIKSTQLS